MRHLSPSPLLAALVLWVGGCASYNPIGFWDLVLLSIEGEGFSDAQEDAGTIEITEREGIRTVLRYDLLDPALVQTGDTGASADLMIPTSPPLRGGGSWNDKQIIDDLDLDDLYMRELEQLEWSGTRMVYEDPDASLFSSLVKVRLELER